MGLAEVQRFCLVDEAGKNLMQAAMQQMNLSGAACIQVPHLAGSLQYRSRERV